VQILAPLPIGFAVFLVHLATIPITGTGINPARSLGAAIIYNKDHSWDDHVSFHTLYTKSHSKLGFEHFSLTISFFFVVIPVGVLGWPLHWSCTCCSLPCGCHQSHPLQVQKLSKNKTSSPLVSGLVLSCFYSSIVDLLHVCVQCVYLCALLMQYL